MVDADSFPLVSVLLSAYNHERYITECLDSVLGQDYPNVEVVLYDDGSTDGTDAVIRAYLAEHPGRVRYESKANEGFCATLNRALAVSTGEFIAVMGTDDVWLPNHLSLTMSRLLVDPQVACSFSDMYFMYGDERSTDRYTEYKPAIPEFFSRPRTVRETFLRMLQVNLVLGGTAVIRRTALEEVGPWDESLAVEDLDMFLRLSRRFKLSFVNEPTAYYRQHPASNSRQTRRLLVAVASTLAHHYAQPPLKGHPLLIARVFLGWVWNTGTNRLRRVRRYTRSAA